MWCRGPIWAASAIATRVQLFYGASWMSRYSTRLACNEAFTSGVDGITMGHYAQVADLTRWRSRRCHTGYARHVVRRWKIDWDPKRGRHQTLILASFPLVFLRPVYIHAHTAHKSELHRYLMTARINHRYSDNQPDGGIPPRSLGWSIYTVYKHTHTDR